MATISLSPAQLLRRRKNDRPASQARITRVDRLRYRARHEGLAVGLGSVIRMLHTALNPRLGNPSLAALTEVRTRFDTLLARDLENVAKGYYPRDVLFELKLTDFLKQMPASWADGPRFLWRAYRRKHDDLPKDVDLAAYPAYYRRTFHWQTDGWLSERSARLYDLNVEVLFGGTGDVMRRMTIPPLVDALRDAPAPRILDIACGTGRYLKTLHRALPRATITGLDLSPFYVARARSNLGGVGGASALTGNAEALPFPDRHFDAALSIFLFHELPSDARRNVMREAFRVLKPGGRFVVNDSAQLVESAPLTFFLEAFSRLYHEPYHKGYLRDDLGKALTEVGFRIETEVPNFMSKLVVATKPLL